MANPNKLAPKIDTRVIIVTGQASAAGFAAPLFVSEFEASASFPTRIKAYRGTRREMLALMAADGFADDSPAYLQVSAAMVQGGPPGEIYIGRRDPGDLTWGATLDAIAAEEEDGWYALCVDVRDSASIQQISAWVEPPGGDPKFALFFSQTASTQVLNASPGNFADVLAALERQRTVLTWHDPETASGYGPAVVQSRIGPFAFGASESLSFRFDGGSEQSFAFTAAAAVVTGTATEPFDLSGGGTLQLAANGLAAQTVTFTATSATTLSAVAETYALSPGDTITARVDGGAAQTATIDAAPAVTTGTVAGAVVITDGWQLDLQINGGGTQSFVFLSTDNTITLVAAKINATAVGFVAAVDGDGFLELTTDRAGTSAEIEILVSSTAGLLTALGLVVGSDTGTGDASNINAVTAAEIATVLSADITGATGADDGGRVRLTSDSSGLVSRIQVTGGSANAIVGFSTAEVSGTGDFANAATASAAEVVSAINAQVAGLVASVSAGAVRLTSDVLGTSSSITVTAGAVATELLLAAGTVAGSGDFADASTATAAEIANVISATIADGSASSPGSRVRLASVTSGQSSTVEILTDTVGLTWSGDGFATGTGVLEDYADCAWVGRCITFALDSANGAALWDNQTLVGILPDKLTDAQKTSLDQRRINAYYSNGGRPEMHWGYVLRKDSPSYFLYIDEVTTADWMDARYSEAMNNVLNNYADQKAKIPFTDEGFGILEATGRGFLERAERNGHTVYDGSLLDLTDDTSTGVFFPRLANLSQSDIDTRRYAGVRIRQAFQGGTQRINSLIELQRPAVQL